MGSGGEQHPHILHQVSSCVCIERERMCLFVCAVGTR